MVEQTLSQKAAEHIRMLEAEIERLLAPPHKIATVLKVLDDMTVLISGDRIAAMANEKTTKGLKPGQLLTINGSGAIIASVALPLSGIEATVKRVFAGDMMEVEGSGGTVLVFKGQATKAKPGDVVQLDRTGSVAIRTLPKDVSAYSVETATGVTWDDIGGQEEAIGMLKEAIEGPIKCAKLYKAYGKKPMKGVLLSGPPGTGKTLLAKATANAVREAHGADEAPTAFIYVKGPEVLNMWVGNTEAQIRALFARAREHKEQHGYPAVIFIDEADAILGKRGSNHGSILASTVVPTFLAEMDGMADSGAFVLLATNRQDVLDPAIVREGRIDRKVRVGRPAMREAAQILRIHLAKTNVADTVDDLAGTAAAEMFSDTHLLYRVGLKGKGVQPFYIRHLVSGAMLAGVVDVGTSIAIRRDRDSVSGKASGLTKADMVSAVKQVVSSNRGINHDDDLMMFGEALGAPVEGVQRIAA